MMTTSMKPPEDNPPASISDLLQLTTQEMDWLETSLTLLEQTPLLQQEDGTEPDLTPWWSAGTPPSSRHSNMSQFNIGSSCIADNGSTNSNELLPQAGSISSYDSDSRKEPENLPFREDGVAMQPLHHRRSAGGITLTTYSKTTLELKARGPMREAWTNTTYGWTRTTLRLQLEDGTHGKSESSTIPEQIDAKLTVSSTKKGIAESHQYAVTCRRQVKPSTSQQSTITCPCPKYSTRSVPSSATNQD